MRVSGLTMRMSTPAPAAPQPAIWRTAVSPAGATSTRPRSSAAALRGRKLAAVDLFMPETNKVASARP